MTYKKRWDFRQLRVRQMSMQLLKEIYELTTFYPSEEKFWLISQMRRSSFSISTNIAEGNERATNKDFSHFLTIAIGSCVELESQLEWSEILWFINTKTKIKHVDKTQEIKKMLRWLRASLE